MNERASPSVSVVMPVRNAAETVGTAMRSVIEQSLRSWELIVIDDGSSDASRSIAQSWADRDERIRVLARPPRGIVAALAEGCDAAAAPIIARMDADDVMDRDRLETQVAYLAAHSDVGVVASAVRFGGDRRRASGFAAHVDWSNALLTHEQMRRARFVDVPVVHPSTAFRAELIGRFGGYREGVGPEDHELWLRWFDAGVRFAKIARPLLTWNDSPHRLTRTHEAYSIEQRATLRCRFIAAELARRREDRALWLWGAGRVTRRRFDGLAALGRPIVGFVDIDPRKIGRRIASAPVVAPPDLPDRDDAFVIVGVGARGAGSLVRDRLVAQGRVEESDFLLAG